MKNSSACFYLVSMFLGFSSQAIGQSDYILVDGDEDGIVVEQFTEATEGYPYTQDNAVFRAHRQFHYSYYHQTAEGRVAHFIKDETLPDCNWKLADTASREERVIKSLRMRVLEDGGPFATPMDTTGMPRAFAEQYMKTILEYSQTVIEYVVLTQNGSSAAVSETGVVENRENIWVHPPRSCFFKILEINPFPYVRLPVTVGETWTWELKVGRGWGDERWATWEGAIENQITYEVKKKTTLETALGPLTCFEIDATASSSIGETTLKAWYHAAHGFVKLEYANIDGSRTVFELNEANP